jgi:hypothetical protein
MKPITAMKEAPAKEPAPPSPFARNSAPLIDRQGRKVPAALMRYSHLLRKLEKEPEKESKLALLKDMASIAAQYYGNHEKAKNSDALEKALPAISDFISRNIRDPQLVSGAVEVLIRTGANKQVLLELDKLRMEALDSNPASQQALAGAYLRIINP